MQLRVIIFISCNFAGLRVIGEISISRNYGVISRNFYNVISRNFVMITRNKQNDNYGVILRNFYEVISLNFVLITRN